MPAAQMIRSPPTPGRAKAASADSDTGARTAFTVFSRSDSAVVGRTLSAAIGAVPVSDKFVLKPAVASPPSAAGALTWPSNGVPATGIAGATGGTGSSGGTVAAGAGAISPTPKLLPTVATGVDAIPATTSSE